MKIDLPASVDENNLVGFAKLIGSPSSDGATTYDISECTFAIPGAVVLLLSQIRHRFMLGQEVYLTGLEYCSVLRYLQRMDFFSHCGVHIEEKFRWHSSHKRFVPISAISNQSSTSIVAKLSTEIADCVFPGLSANENLDETGVYDAVEYSVSEMALNVIQHSRGAGFIHAQAYPNSGLVRIGISDTGIGIRESFAETQPPDWCNEFDDLEALNHALKPQVSSKMHLSSGWGGGPVNAGVGLTLLKKVAEVTGGDFCLMSGNAFHQLGNKGKIFEEGAFLPGTTCALTIQRKNIKSFASTLDQAKHEAGLLGGSSDFSDLFS